MLHEGLDYESENGQMSRYLCVAKSYRLRVYRLECIAKSLGSNL